jgi:hypothetical protein
VPQALAATATPEPAANIRAITIAPPSHLVLKNWFITSRAAPVPPTAHLVGREDGVPGDPFARLSESLARVRLEDDALARPPASGVDLIAKARRKLLLVIMRVALRPEIDIALRQAQGAEIFANILGIRFAGDH